MKSYGDEMGCRESRVVKSTSVISGIHICRSKGYRNGGRHEPVGLVCRAEYAMSKAATSALDAGSLEWLNSAAQSGYASGSLVAAANRGCASTARSGGSYAASVRQRRWQMDVVLWYTTTTRAAAVDMTPKSITGSHNSMCMRSQFGQQHTALERSLFLTLHLKLKSGCVTFASSGMP